MKKNATDGGRFLVSRGIKNINDLGRVLKYQDEPELGKNLVFYIKFKYNLLNFFFLDVWSGNECNRLIGTDSTIFPPFMVN